MYELRKGSITLTIETYEGFEHEYIRDLQADLIQVMNMVQLTRKTSELDDFPTGNMDSIVQLQMALLPSIEDLNKTHPLPSETN